MSSERPTPNLLIPTLRVGMSGRLLSLGLLIGLLALALWLRWRYVQEISLYIDEFTTLWAAQRVQAVGAPIMPSGVLYTRGLLSSYVEAAFLTLFGFSYTVGRLPSVIFGLATIGGVWLMGRRLWHPAVGWLAALGLALLPEAIVWSGRARFYAQLQFFVLLTVWAGFYMITASSPHPPGKRLFGNSRPPPPPRSLAARTRMRRRARTSLFDNSASKERRKALLFVLLFALALFSQEETILLYPALLLATWLWQGWQGLCQPRTVLTHLACLGLLGMRYTLEILGQPGYFETIQADRPYVGLALDVQGAWHTYAPLLIAPERLLWTTAGLLAVGAALWAWWQVKGPLTALPRFHQATLFFALHFACVLGVILFFVGSTWRDSRYLLLVQPFWLLVGAAGIAWFVERIAYRVKWRYARQTLWLLAGSVIFITLFPAAQQVFTQQVEGYDRALAALATQRQPGDVVLAPQPPACALALGSPCDYYALQRGYAEYVIPQGGVLVDRWTGAPLLHQTAHLQQVIQRAPHTWLVIDSLRLATRYEADFIRTVIEQFEIVFSERGVMVLRAVGWRPQPTYTISQTLTPPLTFPPLALTGWERGPATPGQDLPMNLLWQSTSPIAQQYNTSLKVLAADGRQVEQDDGPPARGLIPTTLFFDTPLPDLKTLTLPPDLPPGRYQIQVGVYDVATVTPVGEARALDWFTVGPPPPPPMQTVSAQWRNGLQLVGTDALPSSLRAGDTFSLRLVWKTDIPVKEDYTVFVHLIDAAGQPIAQVDRAPEGGFYPTSGWDGGEAVADSYTLTLPANAAAGFYQLVVGFYQPGVDGRLTLLNGQDRLLLGPVAVAP